MKTPSLCSSWIDDFWEAIRDDSVAFLQESAKKSEGYHFLVDQVHRSLIDYVPRGRGLSSSFILATYRGCNESGWREMVRVATVFELLSKSVLIIDDIIDCDASRFGADSFDRQFEKYAANQGWASSARFGQSTAIFAGQLLTTLAYAALVSANISERKLKQLLSIFLEAWIALDESQLADLAFEQVFPSKSEWYQMAKRRAASHVSTSLRIGSVLANHSASSSSLLVQAGAELGYMYDIRADLLDSFGETGKTNMRGRDLRMRKKTLFICIALEEAPPGEREELRQLFAVAEAPSNRILNIAARWGVTQTLDQLAKHKARAAQLIHETALSPAGKEFFQEIVNRAGKRPTLMLEQFV
jgi:geranylgeranyl pyrophosphate synthase